MILSEFIPFKKKNNNFNFFNNNKYRKKLEF